MMAQFGPAGNPEAFYQAGFKASADMPKWLNTLDLTAYEYSCTRGVTIKETTARLIGAKAIEYGINLSIHAPYYINLATLDETIAQNTKGHFLKSLQVAQWMGADRVIFHMGSPGKQPREQAFHRVKRLFLEVLEEVEKQGLNKGVYLAPEIMGKKNQLGSLAEVLELCSMAPGIIPAVDFGHLYAVSQGLYTTYAEFAQVFDMIESYGLDAANIHIHFSHIEFTQAGEKKHWTFDDPYGPPHQPLLEVIADRQYTPRIICESAGSQAQDAKIMQQYYLQRLAHSSQ